jgi:hypothetical protein
MRDQANVIEVFPLDGIHNVRDVSVKVDVLAHEMGSVAQAREREWKCFVTLLFEAICNATPSPSPEESTADQHEGLPSGLSARTVDDPVGRSQSGHAYSSRKAADHSTTSDVYRSHAIPPTVKSKTKSSASNRPIKTRKYRHHRQLGRTFRLRLDMGVVKA